MRINWRDKRWNGKKGSQLFEELCYEFIKLDGYKNVKHLKGSADNGRDIEAEKIEIEPDSTERMDKYWFQCKLYNRGVGLKNIADSLLNAQNNNINFFVIMTNSHITPSLKEHIEKSNRNKKHGFRIIYIEGGNLEQRISDYQEKFMNPQRYSNIKINHKKKTKINLLDNSDLNLKNKKTSPFTVKDENEFNYIYQKFNYDIIIDVRLIKSHSPYLLPHTERIIKYSISLIDFLVYWFRNNPFNEREIDVKDNYGVNFNEILNVEISSLLNKIIVKNDLIIKEVVSKEFPFMDLASVNLLKNFDYFHFILAKKMQKFYYWLNYNELIKESLSFLKISETNYNYPKLKKKYIK